MSADKTSRLLLNSLLACFYLRRREYNYVICIIWQTLDPPLIGCVCYIFASLFLGLNESTCQIKKNVFYFTSKPLFILEKIKF